MAPKGQKRAGVEKAMPAGKKAKVDPLMKPIVEALEHDESGLSDHAREMLLAGLAGSVGIEANERHALQSMVVSMIGSVIVGVETKLKDAIEASDAKIADVECLKSKNESAVTDAEASLAKAIEAVDARKAALGEASKVVASARGDMSKKTQEQRKANTAQEELQSRRDKLEEGITVHMKSIMECGADNAFDGAAHFKALSPILPVLNMDASLTQTLPTCCAKKPDDRGSFEKLAIEELSKSLAAKASEMDTLVSESSATVKEVGAAMEAAVVAHDAAAAAQGKASQESVTALAGQRDASSAVETTKAALKASLAEHEKVIATRGANVVALDNFRSHNVTSFETLRDRSTHVEPTSTLDRHDLELASEGAQDAAVQHDLPAESPQGKDAVGSISAEIGAMLVNAGGA